jgi:methylmalonyl-CoA/ethylmalonyl-CoA epimerase
MKFHHIGIFVSDIYSGSEIMRKMFPIVSESETFEDFGIGVYVKFLVDSHGIRYEIVAPLSNENPVSGLLKSKKNLLNHVAYEVGNFYEVIDSMTNMGALQVSPVSPAVAFNGLNVVFLYSPLGFVVELIEVLN